ncbi:hypothetical protein B0H14DRAFT_697128 [Mycena olivaceomarginata]|nr:hypothetical protein B0H14DRAFT_697128 [Mycena olivaceomarginata]
MSLPPLPARPPTTSIPTFSPPHYDDPLAAPRPHRVDPSLSANIARDLDNTMQAQAGLAPGFINPNPSSLRTPSPNPPQGEWSPWAPAVTAARTPSPMPPVRLPSPPRDGALTVPLPAVAALTAALPTVTSPAHDPALQLAWARDVLFLVDRTPSLASSPLALAAAPADPVSGEHDKPERRAPDAHARGGVPARHVRQRGDVPEYPPRQPAGRVPRLRGGRESGPRAGVVSAGAGL